SPDLHSRTTTAVACQYEQVRDTNGPRNPATTLPADRHPTPNTSTDGRKADHAAMLILFGVRIGGRQPPCPAAHLHPPAPPAPATAANGHPAPPAPRPDLSAQSTTGSGSGWKGQRPSYGRSLSHAYRTPPQRGDSIVPTSPRY